MPTTINSSTTIGLSISAALQNPVTITSLGTIDTTTTGLRGIFGSYGIFATITNDGFITSPTYGIDLTSGGRVTNGSTANAAARILGANYGIRFQVNGSGTLKNFGTVASTSLTTGTGVRAINKAVITNGAATSTAALISGYSSGVSVSGAGSAVTNFGTITASGTQTTSSTGSVGVYLGNGGLVTNGSDAATVANISGGVVGVEIDHAPGTIFNFGTIAGTTGIGRGVQLGVGGTIANGSAADSVASIFGNGRNAISSGGDATLANFGTILDNGTATGSGVRVLGTATVTNGSTSNSAALISGYTTGVSATGAGSSVVNFGTIVARGTSNVIGSTSTGVYLARGGSVTNGDAANTVARIASPSFAIYIGHDTGTVVNFGTIHGFGAAGRGVNLGAGGSVTNGSVADTTAYIGAAFRNAIYIGGGGGTVTNFATIKATTRNGISLGQGGTITNGSSADTTALISGQRQAIYLRGETPSAVNNFGTLVGLTRTAVTMYLGGSLTNGGVTSTAARITGVLGVFMAAIGTIRNFGTINGTTKPGVATGGGGTVINGDAATTSALIVGSTGVSIGPGLATVANFGTITGTTGAAVLLAGGGTITNGSTADSVAVLNAGTANSAIYISGGTTKLTNFGTISGLRGVRAVGSASVTITNSGTIASISGVAGTAIQLANGTDRVVVVPGASFVGKVDASGGTDTLQLSKTLATGTIGSIGTVFLGFENAVVDTNAKWALTGANTIANFKDGGIVTVNAGGSLNITSAVDPTSTGTFQIATTATLEVAANTGSTNDVKFFGASKLIVDQAAAFGTNVGSLAYTGPLLRSFGALATIAMKDLTFAGLTQAYTPATGLLQLSVGAVGVGTLRFDIATLGVGAFNLSDDGTGHTLIRHF